jgi:hypothetical protein
MENLNISMDFYLVKKNGTVSTFTIAGIVSDISTGLPIMNATVRQIVGHSGPINITYSMDDGWYAIHDVPSCNCTKQFRAEKVGYQNHTSFGANAKPLNFTMTPLAVNETMLIVVAVNAIALFIVIPAIRRKD